MFCTLCSYYLAQISKLPIAQLSTTQDSSQQATCQVSILTTSSPTTVPISPLPSLKQLTATQVSSQQVTQQVSHLTATSISTTAQLSQSAPLDLLKATQGSSQQVTQQVSRLAAASSSTIAQRTSLHLSTSCGLLKARLSNFPNRILA